MWVALNMLVLLKTCFSTAPAINPKSLDRPVEGIKHPLTQLWKKNGEDTLYFWTQPSSSTSDSHNYCLVLEQKIQITLLPADTASTLVKLPDPFVLHSHLHCHTSFLPSSLPNVPFHCLYNYLINIYNFLVVVKNH